MNITDITAKDTIKIGKTSITVKRDNKTRGIVTNCITFQNMQARNKFELNIQLKDLGLDVATKCILKDRIFYYMNDVSHYKTYGEDEFNKIQEEVARVKEHGIMVIEYLS